MYILFDIGGTNMRVASSDGARILAIEKAKTPKNYEKGMQKFEKLAQTLARGNKIEYVIGGIAGPLDRNKERIVHAPNIGREWKGKNIKLRLSKMLVAPVQLENDTALAGLGEAVYGAGKNKEIVAYVTISTGVGGVRIVRGAIDASTFGFEPGHQIIDHDAKGYSKPIELEQLIQGAAIQKRTGKEPGAVKDRNLWKEIATITAHGLHNVSVFWSPQIIVLGGGVSKNIPLDDIKKGLSKNLKIFGGKVPLLRRAQLGDENGLYGALALLRQHKQK